MPHPKGGVGDDYFMKHLASISSDKKAVAGLGYDCLREVIEELTPKQKNKIHDKWEKYFAKKPEFKRLLKGEPTPRLVNVQKSMTRDWKSEMKKMDQMKKDAFTNGASRHKG